MKAQSISFFHIQNRDSKISSESNFNINEQNENTNNPYPKQLHHSKSNDFPQRNYGAGG